MAERRQPDSAGRHVQAVPAPSFPTHNAPRVWLIAQALSPLAVRLIRLLLAHGDYVAACLPPKDTANEGYSADFRALVSECRHGSSSSSNSSSNSSSSSSSSNSNSSSHSGSGGGRAAKDREGWKDRLRTIRCDGRFMGDVTGAVAQAMHLFGRIDILLCNASFTAVGSVEEAALVPEEEEEEPAQQPQAETTTATPGDHHHAGPGPSTGTGLGTGTGPDNSPADYGSAYGTGSSVHGSSNHPSPSHWSVLLHSSPGNSLIRAQFAHAFFANVNFIKAALPHLRAQQNGHILVLSSVGGHLGTPGMSSLTAATWALEGYCDSLAYEIAPFNVRVTIVQPQTEVQILNNKIAFAPVLADYETSSPATATAALAPAPRARDLMARVLQGGGVTTDPAGNFYPPRLPPAALDALVLETVHALTALGGHENPPTRHIVGFEASAAVQEKLKIVSEELEDVVETSLAVDIFDSQLNAEARRRQPDRTQPQPP